MPAEEVREIYGEPNREIVVEGEPARFVYLVWDEGNLLHDGDVEFDRTGRVSRTIFRPRGGE